VRPSQCTFPLCTNPAAYSELCQAHHAQRRRHPDRPLKPLRNGAQEAQVSFRCPAELKRRVRALAKRLHVSEGQIWKEAVEERLRSARTADKLERLGKRDRGTYWYQVNAVYPKDKP
jgi:predicted DNA-binding protein